MKLIALEEHYCTPEIRAAWNSLPLELLDASLGMFNHGETEERLEEIGAGRLNDMDVMGVDVQVISLTTPGTQVLDAELAVALAKSANNTAFAATKANPERLHAFATLPTPDPKAAVQELERCVSELGMKGVMLTGRTRDRSLDAKDFWPIFEAAARLKVPLYIHPQIPVRAVREAYYSGFSEKVNTMLATGGWGWHAESGIQALRMMLAGVFDTYPELQVILGHWGEIILFYLDRIGPTMDAGIQGTRGRTIEEYMKQNVYVTPSGIFSERYLRNAIEVIGIDRLLFSVDYPFQFEPRACDFVTSSKLSDTDKHKFAHSNWERLTAR